MYLALAVFSMYISIKDVKLHRISNRSLAIGVFCFTALALVQGEPLYWQSALFSIAIAPIAISAKVGAGDIKLIALLSLFFLPSTLDSLLQFSVAFTVIGSALAVFSIAKERTLSKSIALAPAICGAVIWCAR
jgi:Flp pilus assembly protein protease CpaA